jgi:uncharacterized DUF497 family protein
MNDDAFEWDDAKAVENDADHGVSFETARDVFRDPFAVDWLDEREAYGELRYATIGMAERTPALCRVCHEGRGDPNYLRSRSRAL